MLDALSGALWAMIFKAVVSTFVIFGMADNDSDQPIKRVSYTYPVKHHRHHHHKKKSKPKPKMYTQLASWYYDGGNTACGFHAYLGVANKRLPCGTKVRFTYHGRSVSAVVQDRGPYVGGRVWDLNQNLARALGFSGVDYVQASVPG